MRAPEILNQPPAAKEVMAAAIGITLDDAHAILVALAKAGFVIAPLEPTNAMFAAYMEALSAKATRRDTIIANIGKARRRWKAMAECGMKIAFSDFALNDH